MVYNLSDPSDAREFWIKTFSDIYNKHAPFKTKRIQQKVKPNWLSTKLQEAIRLRDLLKTNKQNQKQTNKQRPPWGIQIC